MNEMTMSAETMESVRKQAEELLADYGKAKEKLYIRLYNRELHWEKIEGMPHRDFLDLAATCYIDLGETDAGYGSIPVDYSVMNVLGIDEDRLFEDAMANSPVLKPPVIAGMAGMLEQLMGLEPGNPGAGDPMMVLTTEGLRYGAAAVLYPGLLDSLTEKTGCPLFLIPSSVHEFLCLPDEGDVEKEWIRELIGDVNRTTVAPGEVLSGNLYRYDPAEGKMQIA